MNQTSSTRKPPTTETWQEIEVLVDELAQLSKTDLSIRQFYGELVDRAVRALAAVAGAYWVCNPNEQLGLVYQSNLLEVIKRDDPDLQAMHSRLLDRAVKKHRAAVISPHSGSGKQPDVDNPTNYLLVLAPVVVDQETVGLLEVVQQADKSPAVQRGNLELATVLSELAADFHRNQQLRQMRDRQSLWDQFDHFVWHIHQDLDVDSTAFAIANEARRLIDCDRVCVLTGGARGCRVRSISGLETFDRRSGVVRQLEQLSCHVLTHGKPLWFRGELPVDDRAAGTVLQSYLTESPAKLVGVVPLEGSCEPNGPGQGGQPIGALVVEQFEEGPSDDQVEQRTLVIARHSSAALRNAVSLSRLPLMPLQRALAKASWLIRLRQLPLTVSLFLSFLIVVAGLTLIRTELYIEARGELRPIRTATVFAPHDGVVIDFPSFVDDRESAEKGDEIRVTAGDVVVQLLSSSFDYELTSLLGELATADSQLKTIQTMLRRDRPRIQSEVDELSAKQVELDVHVKSLKNRLEILRRQQDELAIKADISGQVLTWDVVQKLRSRPVVRGQKLMTIVDPDGPWVIEMHVPDHHIGYVLAAQERSGKQLDASFILRSDPEVRHQGRIAEVAMATEVKEEYGPSVLVTVDINASRLKDPRPGTTVIAKIHCGRQSIGYVWLHDLIEVVRSRLLF